MNVKRETVRKQRLKAFNAFNARKFPPECIDRIFECADYRGKSTEDAPWNSVDFAKFK